MTPHDQHFKKLLASFFYEFIEAFVPELARGLDRRHVELLDKELIWLRRHFRKAKFVDLVAKVKLQGVPGFILVHIEHQARRDPSLPGGCSSTRLGFWNATGCPFGPCC